MHEYTEIYFQDHEQLVLIAGKNGVGKSTILEAIVYALYGESRSGRKNLDKLVKKGSELEGMSVELVFELAGSTYRITRRRDGRSVTAVMYGNDIPLYEGPNAVTEAVVKLLGLDSQGFRLSTIAQQKELDGLASLKPAEKIAAIKRLLKLDALTRAKESAGVMYRQNKELWRSSLPGDDLKEYNNQLEELNSDIKINKKNRIKTQESIFLLEKLEEELKDHSENYTSLIKEKNELVNSELNLVKEIQDCENQIQNIDIPKLPPKTLTSDQAYEALKKSQDLYSKADKEYLNYEKRTILLKDIKELKTNIKPENDVNALNAELKNKNKSLIETEDLLLTSKQNLEKINLNLANVTAQTTLIESRIASLNDLGGSCATCGQDVTEKHKNNELKTLTSELGALQEKAQISGKEVKECEEEILSLATLKENIINEMRNVENNIQNSLDNTKHNEKIEIKIKSYETEVKRLPSSKPDVNKFKKLVETSEKEFVAAQNFEKIENSIEIAKLRIANLETRRNASVKTLEETREKLGQLEISSELQNKHAEYSKVCEDLEYERKVLEHHILQEAKLEERIKGVVKLIELTSKAVDKAQSFETKAVVASLAGKVLQETSSKLSTQIRPKLEGTMSSLLMQMSNNRFTSVKINEKYEVQILDNNEYVNLSEVSGGELDLIALALRLSLAQVSSGGTGLSFLILDECFGSQDPDRRNSILESLRGLKETYRQILIISHVENMEDYVDKVITVETDSDRKYSYITENL